MKLRMLGSTAAEVEGVRQAVELPALRGFDQEDLRTMRRRKRHITTTALPSGELRMETWGGTMHPIYMHASSALDKCSALMPYVTKHFCKVEGLVPSLLVSKQGCFRKLMNGSNVMQGDAYSSAPALLS